MPFEVSALAVIGTILAIRWLIPAGGVQVTDIITNEIVTFDWIGIVVAVVSGLIAGIAVGLITEFYTATFKSPVGTIVEAAKTGPATTVETPSRRRSRDTV